MINNVELGFAQVRVQLVSMRSSLNLDFGDLVLGGLLKATAVLSSICTLSGLAFYLGVLGPVTRMAQTGIFSTQSYGFLLSVGLAAGFLISAAVARASGRRNLPEANTEDSVPFPSETETV